jgi:4-hydroxy-2-oxoheptanedioate aldolase
MSINPAKQRLLKGETVLGIVLGMGSPVAAEIVARTGFDFVLVDTQHGAWDDLNTFYAFRAITMGGSVPMARVLCNDYARIGRLLDHGALGIVVPLVNTRAESEAAAKAVRYPPRGDRSFGPRLAEFHGADYARRADEEIFLAVQIESIQAVEQVESILAVEGVDGCWIGPNDLARSMGVDYGSEPHREAILNVLDVCQKLGKIPGFAGGADTQAWIDKGFRFVTSISDGAILAAGARQAQQALRAGQAG